MSVKRIAQVVIMAKNYTQSPYPERIQQYLSGEMSVDEQKSFEQEIDAEPALQEIVQESALANWTIQAYAKKEEMAELNALYQDNAREAKRLNIRYYQWMAVAASLALLLVAYFLLRPAPVQSLEQVIAEYYEIPKSPDIMAIDTDEMMRKADQAYENKNWEEALADYSKIHLDSISDYQVSRINFYRGICYIELGKWDEAEKTLSQASQHPEQKDWYLAMICLKKGEIEKCSQILDKIADNPNHFFAPQVQELKEKLQHIK